MQSSCRQNGSGVFSLDQQRPGPPPSRDPQGLTAAELLQRCLTSGDEAAWFEFVRRFQPLIASVVARTVRRWGYPQSSLVDDLVQETYLRLCGGDFRALREFHFAHDRAFIGFLKVVASNVVQDYFRHRCCHKRGSGRLEEDVDGLTARIPSPDWSVEKLQRAILVDNIERCLRKQSSGECFSRDYSIFWLYFEKGFTAKAISRLPGLGLTEKGVESALMRMTRLLKTELSQPAFMA